jgi:hypothetical protein
MIFHNVGSSPFTSFAEIPIFPVEKYGLAEKFLDKDGLCPKRFFG